MGNQHDSQNRIPPEIAVNFRELCPEHDDFDDFLQDQETVYQSLQGTGKRTVKPNPYSNHSVNSRNLSVDDSSMSRTESMNSDVDVAISLSLLDAQNQLQATTTSGSSQTAAGNRGARYTETSITALGQDDFDLDSMTYEELQSLGDAIGVESRGLPENVISRLPSRKFREKSGWFSTKSKSQHQECVICSMEYTSGELMTTLQCKHHYHKECIGKWLSDNKTCPICKMEVS